MRLTSKAPTQALRIFHESFIILIGARYVYSYTVILSGLSRYIWGIGEYKGKERTENGLKRCDFGQFFEFIGQCENLFHCCITCICLHLCIFYLFASLAEITPILEFKFWFFSFEFWMNSVSLLEKFTQLKPWSTLIEIYTIVHIW